MPADNKTKTKLLRRMGEAIRDFRMIEDGDTYSIVKRLVPKGKTYCAVCSRLRRGVLYNIAVEEGWWPSRDD